MEKKIIKTICYMEITLLIISSFAFAYHISLSNLPEIQNQKQFSLFSVVSKFLGMWIARSKISLVSAAEQVNCCPKLKNGASCQDILASKCSTDCAESCLPSKCEQVSSCKLGCCFDSKEGLCQTKTPKGTCEASKGLWSDDSWCNSQDCRLGCCVLGKNTQFITESRCNKLSAFYGLGVDFKKEVDTELGCLALSYTQAEGACIINDERDCKFTTKAECLKLTNDQTAFFEKYLCSNAELNTSCTKQTSKGCVENRDEVYWFDSCGNRENIYDSNKDKSWNNGRFLEKDKSCSFNFGNAESCGNCDYALGSTCKNINGDYKCADLNCKQAKDNVGTKDRKNGESWCVYDGYVGEGKDVVGSRHYKYYCLDGEVKSEPCADFRQGICVQQDIKTNVSGMFSVAACKVNDWRGCLEINSKAQTNGTGKNAKVDYSKLIADCSKNTDCFVKEFNFGKGYHFYQCLPNYPPGFELALEDSANTDCSMGDYTCTKVETKSMGSWKCVAGCDCTSKKATQQMNDWCASLGDCGAYVNTQGKVTDEGYTIKKAPRIDATQYVKYATPVAGQKASPGNLSFASIFGSNGGLSAADFPTQDPSLLTLLGIQIAKGVVGLAGVAIAGGQFSTAATIGSLATSTGGFDLGALMGFSTPSSGILTGAPAYLAGFGTAAAAASAGMIVGYMIGKMFGVTGDDLFLVSCASGSAAAVAATIYVYIYGFSWIPVIGWALAAAAVVAIILSMAFGGGASVRETKVEFKCLQWQPPLGGDDCSKCSSNPLEPCTRYQCSSLGQLCELINEGTGNELCISNNPGDVSPPIISPMTELITKGYAYSEINSGGFKVLKTSGECLKEFEPVEFGIESSEPSQCKYSFEHTQNYDEMIDYFGAGNLYLYNHTTVLNIPSVDSILAGSLLNASEIEKVKQTAINKLGNLTLYLRCQDKSGNANLNEYLIRTCIKAGPDLTPPYVTKSIPDITGYISYNSSSKDISVWTNEPANCRYSLTDNSYDAMNKTFNCLTSLNEAELFGWRCTATLTGLNSDNSVYVKCKDQPWLLENNKSRNAMTSSYVLNLKKSSSVLKITKISPSEVRAGIEPVTAKLEITTEGGAENGKAECSYGFNNYDNVVRFFNTYSQIHTQELNQLVSFDYNLYFKCADIAGNIALANGKMKVILDTSSPKILRVYNSDGLKISTDEDSTCSYSLVSCSFNIANGTMMTGIEKEHSADWIQGRVYYIKCKDVWNNRPDGCSIIAKAEENIEIVSS